MQVKDLQQKRALRTALLVLLLNVLGLGKMYAYDFSAVCETGQTLYYKFTGSEVALTYPNSSYPYWEGFTKPAGDIVLPESVQYNGVVYTVTRIDERTFFGCSDLTGSLTIPNSVTRIGQYAFQGCRGFTGSLIIGNSVTNIDSEAFDGCNNFSFITILSETPPYLGYHALQSLGSISPIYVPCGFEEAYASLSWGGFSNFEGLCGGTVTVIASPEEGGMVTGSGMFGANQTCTVTATANEGYAFVNWTYNGVIVSRNETYTINVVGDMTLIAHFASEDNITFADTNVKAVCVSHWDTNGDNELSYAEAASVTSLSNYFQNNSEITSFVELQYFIGLSSIGYYAFDGCIGLTSIELPSFVTFIGNAAFNRCTGLATITIPNLVTSIGSNAFQLCRGLTSIDIPNSVTTIGSEAFSQCSGLISIEIPTTVTSIGTNPFIYCSSLEQIIVDSGNTVYDSRENCNAIIKTSTNELISGCKNTVIPNSVTSIGGNAFSGCSGLTSMEIPNSVSKIGYGAFTDCRSMVSIVIPNSVNSIEHSAFHYCTSLTTITIPQSVTSINMWTFYGCISLTSVNIGNSVTSIGNKAFYNCHNLASLTIFVETPPTLGDDVFYNVNTSIPIYVPCASLSAYQNDSGWNEFTNYFEMCLGTITVSASPTEGGTITGGGSYEVGAICTLTATPNEGYTFINWMENGTIVSNDSEYSFVVSGDRELVANFVEGEMCFITFELYDSYGDGYTENYLVVTDENGSQQLTIESGSSAIYTLPFLTDSHITLTWIVGLYPEDCSFTVSYSNGNVIYYGENLNESFSYEFDVDCDGMPVITFDVTAEANPIEWGSVTGAGQYDYYTTCTLTATPNEGYSFAYWAQDGSIVSTDIEYTFYVVGNTALVAYFVPLGNIIFADDNVKAICVSYWDTNGDGELSYSEAADITYLGSAFRFNSAITSFDEFQYFISLTSIESNAFRGCTNLTSIDLPNSVTSIRHAAFEACNSLISIELPNSVTYIESNPFVGCSNLEQIIVDSENIVYDSRDNCNAIIETSTNVLVVGCKNTVIPISVISIGNNAFWNCDNLTLIEIPNSVTTIGYYAFSGCTSLNSIYIPNSVTTIGYYAFAYCTSLTSIELPNSVTSLGYAVFAGCNGLEQIIVASDNLHYDSRENCNAIIQTSTNTLVAGCKNTVIPNSVTSIGSHAFCDCQNLTSIEIPNSVVSIDTWAFHGCSSLTSIDIPNSVTTIGYIAFAHCTNLTSIELPNSVTMIDQQAFYGCNGLREVIMFGTTPPSLGLGVFNNLNNTNDYPIYIPYESLNDYKTATNWSNYESRIFPMAYTTIPGYGESDGNYRFIASPLVENTDPTTVDYMITETPYDLYRFDQSEDAEWQNYKAHTENFVLENGQGYLYANVDEVNVIFKGEFNEDDTKEVELAYDANADFAGWNLVGNPFPVSAYANKSYYTMNEDGTGIEPNMVSSATAIPVCTGVMVKAEDQGESVVFSKETPEIQSKGCLHIALSQAVDRDGVSTGSTTLQDKAIVSFNAGDRLEKFVFNKDNARINIPQGGKDLAIACADKQGEMPLNFKATKNGLYTLSVDVENADVDYLHLIDNLTGADVDLLVSPEYTFDAKTSDYASRFRLVFSVCGDADGDNAPFAFISNGNIIVTGAEAGAEAGAVLQIVDMTGRVIRCTDVARNVSTNEMTPGVYVLRLINGNDVKTQKIVID